MRSVTSRSTGFDADPYEPQAHELFSPAPLIQTISPRSR